MILTTLKSTWNDHAPVEAPLPSARKRKSNEAPQVPKAEPHKPRIEALKTSPDEKLTEDETFGKIVADTLSHYTGLKKAIAKKKITDVLFELEIGAFNNESITPSNTLNSSAVQYIVLTPNFSQFQTSVNNIFRAIATGVSGGVTLIMPRYVY